jgi:hypothetical protein
MHTPRVFIQRLLSIVDSRSKQKQEQFCSTAISWSFILNDLHVQVEDWLFYAGLL